jgi:hypothetical protein
MTIERRTFIDLSDIMALEYECKHCGARHSIPLNKMDRGIELCPNCREEWLSDAERPGKQRDTDAVRWLVTWIRDIRQRELGATIRFQITPDAAAPASSDKD